MPTRITTKNVTTKDTKDTKNTTNSLKAHSTPLGAQALRVPQLRVLAALRGGGIFTRPKLAKRCKFSPLSGTVTRVMNGIEEGSGESKWMGARPGLLELGLVERLDLDVDGAVETCYRITQAGKDALEASAKLSGKALPPLRDKDICTNLRYQ